MILEERLGKKGPVSVCMHAAELGIKYLSPWNRKKTNKKTYKICSQCRLRSSMQFGSSLH